MCNKDMVGVLQRLQEPMRVYVIRSDKTSLITTKYTHPFISFISFYLFINLSMTYVQPSTVVSNQLPSGLVLVTYG